MAEIFRVNNLGEALNLARQFNSTGQYNLFRGQGQNWKVKSTLARLNKSDFEKGIEKLKRLHYYLQTHQPLEKFVSEVNWFYAVAQHYGMPTNYIDFTRSVDVAAFFATNSPSNKIGEDCVIVCLQENNFNDFLKFTNSIYVKDNVVAPYIAKPNVDNLWRLQAQQGCFVFTPYENFEFYYDFDKIIFPFSEPYQEILKENIYPERKSELEILLDHFFNSEKRIEGQKRFNEFIRENKIPSYELPKTSFNDLLKSDSIHYSWKSILFNEWTYKIDKELNNSIDINKIEIHFDLNEIIYSQIEEVVKELSNSFINKAIDRNSSLKFEIIAKPKLSKRLLRIISNSCSRIWDGTRNLPFSTAEIHRIIAKYICLEIYEDKLDKIPSLSSEELLGLELVNEYGSITRCYASPSKIISSFRDDLDEILINELSDNISAEILFQVNKPDLLFDFSRLLELFKDELIPYQVLYNSETKNPVIFFTPTQIAIMGYA